MTEQNADEVRYRHAIPCPACWSQGISSDCAFCRRTEAIARALFPDNAAQGGSGA